MSTYAVGDLQGCLQPLQCLLERVSFDPAKDTLWLTGDLINRGPESLATLRFVYEMRDSVISVLGNHDLHLLAVANGHKRPSRSDTLNEILNAEDRDLLLGWLRQLPLIHRDSELGYTMVHAGIPPHWSLDTAQAMADEMHEVLRGNDFQEFLANMYGNTPDNWSNQLTGQDRWRIITNYFTRMRFCTAEGQLELTQKDAVSEAPAGFAPWFEYRQRQTRHDQIIFGHWAALEGKVSADNVFALDSGCVWGGKMTMMRLEDRTFYRCDCKAE